MAPTVGVTFTAVEPDAVVALALTVYSVLLPVVTLLTVVLLPATTLLVNSVAASWLKFTASVGAVPAARLVILSPPMSIPLLLMVGPPVILTEVNVGVRLVATS